MTVATIKKSTTDKAAHAPSKKWRFPISRTPSRYSTDKAVETACDIPVVNEEVRRIWKQAEREGR